MAANKRVAASADKLVDLVAVEPFKRGGVRINPGTGVIGVASSEADELIRTGLAVIMPVGAPITADAGAPAASNEEAEPLITAGSAASKPGNDEAKPS